jgi:hypothetical protein
VCPTARRPPACLSACRSQPDQAHLVGADAVPLAEGKRRELDRRDVPRAVQPVRARPVVRSSTRAGLGPFAHDKGDRGPTGLNHACGQLLWTTAPVVHTVHLELVVDERIGADSRPRRRGPAHQPPGPGWAGVRQAPRLRMACAAIFCLSATRTGPATTRQGRHRPAARGRRQIRHPGFAGSSPSSPSA